MAVINEKGGVGKTTTVATLGHALAALGKHVLLVDLDPQANLTAWIGADDTSATIADVLIDKSAIRKAIGKSTAVGVDLVSGSRSAADAGDDLRASSPAPAAALRRALRLTQDAYDLILIDCPPGLGVLSVNALCAADQVLIPINSQAMALSGAAQLRETLAELLEAEVISSLPSQHALLTMYDARRALAREVREYLQGLEQPLCTATIRTSARMAECYGHHRTIYDYAPREAVAADYTQLAEELSHEF